MDFMDIETQKPAHLETAEKLPNSIIVMRAKSPPFKFEMALSNDKHPMSQQMSANTENINDDDSMYRLPSPNEISKALSKEYPSSYIPIDTSGRGFQRMSTFRRSLIHSEFLIRRKNLPQKDKRKIVKRRNTFCENDAQSVTVFENEKKLRRKSEGSIQRIDNCCQTETNEEEIYNCGRIIDFSTSLRNKVQLKVEVHNEEEQFHDCVLDNYSCDHSKRFKINSAVSPTSSTGIKLRGPLRSKLGDDGRSSSGNWSASSSTHASVDSDNVVSVGELRTGLNISSSSIEDDSVISESCGQQTVKNSLNHQINEHLSDSSTISSAVCNAKSLSSNSTEMKDKDTVIIRSNSKVSMKIANRNSESWLHCFEYDSSRTVTPDIVPEIVVSDCETVTSKTNSPGLKKRQLKLSNNREDDELESVYSVDNDGYYTSMHTDSAVLDVKGKEIPSALSRSHSHSPTFTASESERSETVRRFKSKTLIDANTYPSLCAPITTSEGSCDETNISSSSSSESVNKKRRLSFGSYKRFRIKDIFGSLTTLSKSLSKSKESVTKKKKSSPVPFNMYGESSFNKSKAIKMESQVCDVNPSDSPMLTTFDTPNERFDDLNLNVTTKLYPTHRYCPLVQKRPLISKCRSLDKNETIVYASNSMGRRRDGHPMNYLNKYEQQSKSRAATIPSVSKPRISSPLNKAIKTTTNSTQAPIVKKSCPNERPVKENGSYGCEGTRSNADLKSTNIKDNNNIQHERSALEMKKLNKLNSHNNNMNKKDSTESSLESVTNIDIFNNKKSKLSTEDLLVLIHTSKKKLSAKKDSSTSLNFAESVPLTSSPQEQIKRQSWAGETPLNQVSPRSRHSLVIDRLGQVKPTTINDFKRLLSQTRMNSSAERRSASEMLKASSPFTKRPATPIVKIPVSNVPVDSRTRVINGRVYRSPYRLETMYPPIEEVCSEENLLKADKQSTEVLNVCKTETRAYVERSSTWV
ncbi:hypothetical protein B4U80_07155 [Leptotrombidium deliense]|uniref:WASP family protein member n=1 Tax=Leptotrombidium deliense TaxID=299467 RepID=A0A443SLS9_9ACAR|nr:hypothetical protein B4U80_07155 [Leptotrombidium deliense]